MRRSYKLDELGCANCASKMECDIQELDGVNKATINFMLSKLILDVEDGKLDEVLEQAQKICHEYEPDCDIIAGR